MWALAIVAALWPTLAHAQEGGGLPIPGSWWELVLGGATLILTGGFGGSTIIGRLRSGQAAPMDSELGARIKAIEDAGRASAEQSATAERDKRLSELESKVTSLSAETATLRAMVSQASVSTTAGLEQVAASLKRIEGGV
jgi:hypothetical protein